MADLGARERAALPDSAFAYIDAKGTRRLPIHDEAHVRNALARFNRVLFDDEAARDRARSRLLRAAKRHGIMPVGFIDGQLRPRLPTGQLTLLFSDLVDSTGHIAALGERYGPMLATVRRTLRGAVRRAGGAEVDARADEYFAVFTTAAAALEAAQAIQRTVAGASWPDGRAVALRIGLHTGRPTLSTGAYVGIAVSTGARICARAEGGQVLLSRSVSTALGEDAAAGLRPLGAHRLRGIPDEIELFEALPKR
ncbi:MAG TPA: adenylate/guanylate cyclase domain-containing protein [Candidatus Limnocylindria bacterium]